MGRHNQKKGTCRRVLLQCSFLWLFCVSLLASSYASSAKPAPLPSPLPPVVSPPPPRRPFVEESLPSTDTPHVVIVGTKQSESEDQQSVFVEGTLQNQGTGPTKQIQVKVEALDEVGHVITTASALPVPQEIPPGGSATFVVRFANDPAVRSFHVEAKIR